MDSLAIFDIKTFFKYSNEAWAMTDLNGNFCYMNSYFIEYLELKEEETNYLNYKNIHPFKPVIDKVNTHFNLVLETKKRLDAVVTLEIGESVNTYIIEISPGFSECGITGFLVHIRYYIDISMKYFIDVPCYGKLTHSIPMKPFSAREWEVLFLLYRGVSRKRISSLLNIKETSVRNIISRIFLKVNISGKDALLYHGLKKHWHLYVPQRFTNISYNLLINT